MPSHRPRPSRRVAVQMAELAFAAPQVIAHRVTRMALAGATPSARDRKEFDGMVAEKTAAFREAWQAMAVQSLHAQQALATAWLRAFWRLPGGPGPSAGQVAAQLQGAALGVLGKGLAPVHRKAVANARRLARTKLR